MSVRVALKISGLVCNINARPLCPVGTLLLVQSITLSASSSEYCFHDNRCCRWCKAQEAAGGARKRWLGLRHPPFVRKMVLLVHWYGSLLFTGIKGFCCMLGRTIQKSQNWRSTSHTKKWCCVNCAWGVSDFWSLDAPVMMGEKNKRNYIKQLKLTQIWSLTLFSFLYTVFTLKSIPTVLTKELLNVSSAYLNRKLVFPTLLFPMMSSLNI